MSRDLTIPSRAKIILDIEIDAIQFKKDFIIKEFKKLNRDYLVFRHIPKVLFLNVAIL